MSEFSSRQRPLASHPDLLAAERAAVRRATAIGLGVFAAVLAVITTLVVTSPTQTGMIAMLGP